MQSGGRGVDPGLHPGYVFKQCMKLPRFARVTFVSAKVAKTIGAGREPGR